jgi:xylulokinase
LTPLLLGIDLGTSSLKAGLFDRSGQALGFASVVCPIQGEEQGRAEHDPEQWWEACRIAVGRALAQVNVPPQAVAGIGISGFHHCPVFLRANGRPARPTILTHDRRLHDAWDDLCRSGVLEELTVLTGSMISPGHFPPIFHWVRQHDPQALAETSCLLLPKDYLRMRLTGQAATEICDATGTNLIPMPEREWSGRLCSLAGVPPELLPRIGTPHEICGVVQKEAAETMGLKGGTPVCFGGGDSHCAMLGLGVVDAGQVAILLGTNGTLRGCFRGLATHPRHKVWVQQHVVPGMFTASASTMAGASVMDWFCRSFCPDWLSRGVENGYAAVEQAVAGVAPGSDGLVFNPYISGERSPFLNPRACGTFTGIRSAHGRPHFVRAVWEGVACCLANCLDLLDEVGTAASQPLGTIRMAGGASRLTAWCHIIAGIVGRPITLVGRPDAGCLGAAMLAGIATSVYSGFDDAVTACLPGGTTVEPCPEEGETWRELRERFNRLTQIIGPEFFK